jgi:hypothetical protein
VKVPLSLIDGSVSEVFFSFVSPAPKWCLHTVSMRRLVVSLGAGGWIVMMKTQAKSCRWVRSDT